MLETHCNYTVQISDEMGWQYINIDHNTHCWSGYKNSKYFRNLISQHNQIPCTYFFPYVIILAVN